MSSPATDCVRRGDWMQTFTGRQFWPIDPDPADVVIEDIAHALALQCRFGGHCITFYSVAEHSVLLTRWMRGAGFSEGMQRYALLHDAAEAYVSDVVRPLKPSMPGFGAIEDRVQAAIHTAFGLPNRTPQSVKEADRHILVDEQRRVMARCAHPWNVPAEHLGVTIEGWSPWDAEAAFLIEFDRLWPGLRSPSAEPCSAIHHHSV